MINKAGFTPLGRAVIMNNFEIVQYFLHEVKVDPQGIHLIQSYVCCLY